MDDSTPQQEAHYQFDSLPTADRPRDVQYTPEFEEGWILPTGNKSGGSRDDIPIQGLELAILSKRRWIQPTVTAVLDGLEMYYTQFGCYPRHKILADESAFTPLTADGYGIVAVVQPRPTSFEDLTEHFKSLQADPAVELLTAPNFESTLRNVVCLQAALVRSPDTHPLVSRGQLVRGSADLEEYQQVASTPVLERYTALGANKMYDPTADGIDFENPDAETVGDLSFEPSYLNIDCWTELYPISWYITSAERVLGVESRG